MRSFHKPVCLRLTIGEKTTLAVKVLSGKGGYALGKLETEKTLAIKQADVDEFLRLLDDAEYRHMVASATGQGNWLWLADNNTWIRKHGSGYDGATWLLETCSGNQYFFAERWSP